MSLIPNRTTKPTRKSPQEIMNNSEDQDFNISCVEIAGYDLQNDRIVRILADANGTLKISDKNYARRIAYTSGDLEEYVGTALPGTTEGSASWQIMKLTYSGTGKVTSITWADGDDNFDNIWTNYSSLSYS